MSVDLQKRIKDDQEDVAAYVEELVRWEDDIATKDDELKRKAANVIPAFPPIRGTKESELPRMSEKEEKALQEKELGNTAFKRGKLEVALRHYTKSLEYWPGSAVVYSNRAQVYLKQKEWQAANRDATTAIKLTCSGPREQCTSDNVKSYFRRASARVGLRLYNQAKTDLEAILAFDPQHKEARAELRQVEEALRRLDEELEEKRGRKRLVIQEVEDEDEDEDEGAAAGPGGRGPTPGAVPGAAATAAAAVPAPGLKKGKAVVIEEVDDDEEDEGEAVPLVRPAATPSPAAPSLAPAAKPAPAAQPAPPKPAPPKPAAPKPATPPAATAPPFRPKNAMDVRRGTPMLIEEIEDDDEEPPPPAPPAATAAAPKAAPVVAAAPTAPMSAPTSAPAAKRVVIEEVDDEDDEGEPAAAAPAAPPPPVGPTPSPAPTPAATPAPVPAGAGRPKAKPASVYETPAVKLEPRPPLEDTVAQRERSAKPANPVDTVPTTFFEFEEAWRDLRRDDARLAAYLLRIDPPAFKTLFKHSLTYDVLVDVLRCLDHQLPAQPTEAAAYHALRVLYSLAQVPRFGELAMFLAGGEKAYVRSLVAKAAGSGLAADKVAKARERLAQFGL